MTGLALRGLAQRKLRSALTAIAVLLGVAMISGTYVLTDQIRNGFEDLEASVYRNIDVEIAPKESFTSQFSVARPLDEGLVERVEKVPGVAKAEGALFAPAALVIDGDLKVATGGGGTFVTTASGEPFRSEAVVDGHLPEGVGEVALVRATADKYDLEPGDRIGVATTNGTQSVVVVGTFEIGTTDVGGTDVVTATLADMQRWFDRPNQVSTINVAADDGITPEQLVRRLRPLVPRNAEVRTGQAAGAETAAEVNDQIGGFLTPALLAFAGAALLVGAFIIFNTFTITVAERTREFALLRTLGATRRQILGAVTLEALVIGVVASLAGLAVGLLFAKGVAALFETAGFGIPTSGLELAPRTIAAALIVGVGVTLLAAVSPARRATRVPPIAALQRGDQSEPTRRSRFAPWIAGALVLLGVAMVAAGLFASGPASSRLSTMAGGVVLLFIGMALSARWFVRPLAAAIGWPLQRAFAEPGLLARENAMRNPGRTATTAAALMVGLGLVVFVAVFANGIKSAISDSVGDLVKADLIVRSETMGPLPAGAQGAVARVPEAGVTAGVQIDQIRVNGKKSSSLLTDIMNGVEPTTFSRVYDFDWVSRGEDPLPKLHGNNVVVEEQFSKAHGVGASDFFRLETPSGGRARVRVVGVYRDPQLVQGTIVPSELFGRVSSARDPWLILMDTPGGVPISLARAQVDAALEPFPAASVESRDDYTAEISKQFDRFVYLLYALLAMSVVISLFGIANSLVLSIHERTREFGLLRAVGCTRRQVRQMVRYESVITAVIGGLLGTVVGVVFAFLVTESLGDLGLSFAAPIGQLVVFLVLAVVVGVIAAVAPARRGARLQVLDALRAE